MSVAKVLIAEDEASVRSLICLTLDSGGFEILEVEEGTSAVLTARREHPALLFLDWAMPGKSGIDVCRELRADPLTSQIRIVMLTARSEEDGREAALAAGADDYITKPFSPLELLDKVSEVLGPDALLVD